MRYGLKPHIVKAIQEVLSTNTQIEKAIIYGSRAKGNYKPGSDIDLIILAPALRLSDLLRLETKLDDLLLPYKIDISLYHQIENKDLLDHIEKVGMVFYDKKKSPQSTNPDF
jgi:predicted nucleotidyltransferase